MIRRLLLEYNTWRIHSGYFDDHNLVIGDKAKVSFWYRLTFRSKEAIFKEKMTIQKINKDNIVEMTNGFTINTYWLKKIN